MRHKPIVAVLLLLIAVAGCSGDPEKLKMEYLKSGDQFLAEKKYAEATIQFRNAIAQDAGYGEARFKLAQALEGSGDYAGAFREFIRAADLMPKDSAVQLRAGQMLLAAKQYPEARARAEAVLTIDAKNVDGLMLLGNALAGLKDISGAVSQLEEAIAGDPNRMTPYMNLGVLQLSTGDRKAAEAVFKRAVDIQPASATAHWSLGNYYWSGNQRAEAETELLKAHSLAPKTPTILIGLATFYAQNNRPADAEKYLKDYVAIKPSDVQAQVTLVDFYLASRRMPEASAMLQSLVKQNDGFVPATLRLAIIDRLENHPQQAYSAIDSVLAREATNEEALLIKGRYLIEDKRPAEALVVAKKIVEANPRSASGLLLQGIAYDATGSMDEAIKALREVLVQSPSNLEAQQRLVELYLARNNPDGAVELAGQMLRLQPQSGVGHFLMAKALSGQGNFARAETELAAVAKANPKSADIQNLFGSIYARQGKYKIARESYGRALELRPESLEAVAGLVQADLAEKNPSGAKARIQARLDKSPDDPAVLTLAGATFTAVGDGPQAEAAFRKAIEKNPSNFDAYRSLANLYMAEHRLDDARKGFEEAARQRPNEAVGARTMIGTILEIQNKRDEARKEYEKALALDPQAAVAANNLAWTYADSGDNLDVALQLAQTAKSQLPNSAEVTDTLGWIYYKKGLATLAVNALKESATQDPSNPVIHYHLGLAYAKNGNGPAAERSLREALKLDPQFAGADDAKRVLGTLKG